MKVIWQRQTATVRDVYETLLERRQIAYTTVMTMMKILEEKGYLKKSTDGKAAVYAPTNPKQKVVKGMVSDFVERVFDGAAAPLMLHLAGSGKLTDHDIEEISALLEQKRRQK